MDSNGVATLAESYEHLAMTGRLVVFGFHTNLPMGKDCLSPIEWIRMARKVQRMPKFDPMEMGMSNKAILAFNLSFLPMNGRCFRSCLILLWIGLSRES